LAATATDSTSCEFAVGTSVRNIKQKSKSEACTLLLERICNPPGLCVSVTRDVVVLYFGSSWGNTRHT